MADTQAKEEDEAILSAERSQSIRNGTNAEFFAINGDIVDKGDRESDWNWLFGHARKTW